MPQQIEVPGVGVVEFPDGMTDDQITKAIKANSMMPRTKAKIETPQFEKDAAAIRDVTPQDLIAGHPATRFALGAADLARGAGQFLGNLSPTLNLMGLGRATNENETTLQGMVDRGRRAYGSEGMDAMRLMGNVVNPVGLATAGVLGPATGAVNAVKQGATIGALSGAGTPVANAGGALDYAGSAGLNAGIGGVFGGFATGAVEGAKAVGRGIRNVFTQGTPMAGARLANLVAGPNAGAVQNAMANSADNVPGSVLTAGQAATPANSAEFAALQKIVENANPSKYHGTTGVQGQQEAARRAAIGEIGRTPQELEAAIAAREAAASVNYPAAFAQPVRGDPALARIAQNPYFKDALGDAYKLAEAKSIDPKQNLTEFLQLVKFSLDKKLGKTGDDALGSAERSVVYDLKKQLVSWMGNKNKLYELARSEFADASKPINQMEVGQTLEKAIATPVGANERAGVFANAMNSAPQTIKKSLGGGAPRYEKLEDVLTPQQVTKAQMVMKDLLADQQYENLAKAGMGEARRITKAGLDVIPQVGMLDRAMMVINNITRRFENVGSHKTLIQLGDMMQNPKEMARLMKLATPKERSELVAAILGGAPAALSADGRRQLEAQ